MSDWIAFAWMAAGAAAAVLLPYLAEQVRREFPRVAGVTIPPWVKTFGILFAFSVVAAGVSLAVWRTQNPTGELAWFTAFLVGFAWEATLEKFFRPRP